MGRNPSRGREKSSLLLALIKKDPLYIGTRSLSEEKVGKCDPRRKKGKKKSRSTFDGKTLKRTSSCERRGTTNLKKTLSNKTEKREMDFLKVTWKGESSSQLWKDQKGGRGLKLKKGRGSHAISEAKQKKAREKFRGVFARCGIIEAQYKRAFPKREKNL